MASDQNVLDFVINKANFIGDAKGDYAEIRAALGFKDNADVHEALNRIKQSTNFLRCRNSMVPGDGYPNYSVRVLHSLLDKKVSDELKSMSQNQQNSDQYFRVKHKEIADRITVPETETFTLGEGHIQESINALGRLGMIHIKSITTASSEICFHNQ